MRTPHNPFMTPELVKAIESIEALQKDAEQRADSLEQELEHQDEVIADLVDHRARTWQELKATKIESSGYQQALNRMASF